MSDILNIISVDEVKELKSEMNDLLTTETEDAVQLYDEMQDLLASYGFEMDYFEQLLCY